MAEGDLDGGPSNSERRDVRERVDVHRLTNVIQPGASFCQNGWNGARQCRILGHGEASQRG
jgi:hypothetical protein